MGMMSAALMAWYILCIPAYAATAKHTEFKPGEIWTDTSGAPINAHGGGILYHDKVYYWYGEIKTGKTWLPECNRSWDGTRVETVGSFMLFVQGPVQLEVRGQRASGGAGRSQP